MLQTLSIRNIVLIERLDIDFGAGLCVLTGETGTGKTILLEALGLALGNRADTSLIRHNAESGSISASFQISKKDKIVKLLHEHGYEHSDLLILRRVLKLDGPSRAFINGEPVSIGFLKEIGNFLAEIQTQQANHDFFSPSRQRALLDQFGNLEALSLKVKQDYNSWKVASNELDNALNAFEEIRENKDYLNESIREIEFFNMEEGEEERLVAIRSLLRKSDKIMNSVEEIDSLISGPVGVNASIQKIQSILQRAISDGGKVIENAIIAVDRLSAEGNEVESIFSNMKSELNLDPKKLLEVEDRLFGLRALARKHKCSVNSLLELCKQYKKRLELLNNTSEKLQSSQEKAHNTRNEFEDTAVELSRARQESCAELEKSVLAELQPLRLNNAIFHVAIYKLEKQDWGLHGSDRVVFEATTNLGEPLAALSQIASGGEMSRFMLALQVALLRGGDSSTLIFDEADSGVGGATADAVGERLFKLSFQHQVLAITHSPQVAVRGKNHYRIEKETRSDTTWTNVEQLGHIERREEIARMLAGAEITDEARAAADRLIEEALPEISL